MPLRNFLRYSSAFFAATLPFLLGCGSSSHNSPASGTPTSNPLQTVVFLGDSLTAGYQNGSLLDTQQPHGYANVIATQAKFSITMPLIAPPGAPAVLQLVRSNFPPVITQSPGTTTGRDNPTQQPTDLAVPGHLLHDILNTTPSLSPTTGQELMTSLVLGFPLGNTRSQLSEAIALKPTTVIVWAGNNDALIADEAGTPAAMTSVSSFTTDFTQLMTTLKSQVGSNIIVANIPDVTTVPYMTPGSLILNYASTLTGYSTGVLSAALGLQNDDLVNAEGLATLEAELAGTTPLAPLPASAVLTASEAATVRSTVDSYNQVIQQQAAAVGATVVDMHAYFASLQTGVTINGKTLTTAFLGGLFGLDGIHPTNTGYALVANQFIAAMNAKFNLSIPAADIQQIHASDPYARIQTVGPTIIPASAAKQTDLLLTGWKGRFQ